MSNHENSTALLMEVPLLLEAMILELELRGCENHHPIVSKAKAMQNKIKQLNNNANSIN
ncbi:hypothetical protein [Psychromonas sp. MME2]|uniref:hypothetical protein n=1 Tax=unclassified Psychromonas TaxID=2614957 RepID=UPI00339D2BAF